MFLGVFVMTLGITAVFIEFLDMGHGYLSVIIAVLICLLILMIDRRVVHRRYANKYALLLSDIELKDLLYSLMEKTADYENNSNLYEDILQTAIHAISYGEKGSIIDVRNRDLIAYVAVEGFERKVLEDMCLGYKDTYLYKETDGRMDRTVIISNSVNYNKLHSNDELVKSLIEAGTAGVQSTICTPIIVRGEVIGMINVDSPKKNAFTDKDIKVIEIFAIEVGKIIKYHEILQENLYLSHYDAMTQIYNRGYFYELHKSLYHDVGNSSYVFVSMDINNLKMVNDTYGHSAGDDLIRHFTKGIQRFLPESAIFGRYGGDEFNILLPEATVLKSEKLMKSIGTYFQENAIIYNDHELNVSYSYGIIKYPDEETNYEQLIIKADQRMYAQKKNMKG